MTTTKKIIIVVIALLVLGLGVLWFLSMQKDPGVEGQAGGGFSIRNFLPFGNPDETPINNEPDDNILSGGGSSTTNTEPTSVPLEKLRKIGERPVAGAVIFMRGTTSVVRFTEKATGNVYEAYSNAPEIKRLTNETLPKTMRAFWLPDGSGFLAQSLTDDEVIETSFVRLSLNSSSSSPVLYNTSISNLPTGIEELSISPSGKKVFYYSIDQGTAKGYVSNPDGTSPNLVFSNYITEWIPNWYSESSILLSSKAASGAKSVGYILDPNNKRVKKVYDSVGVSSLPSTDGKYILLGNGLTLNLLEVSKNTTSNTNFHTLTEKCAWDPTDSNFVFCGVPQSLGSDKYPESWYQGKTSTNDLLDRINVFDNYTNLLIDPKNTPNEETLDVSNVKVSKDGKFLIFNNKKNSSLWMLDVR